MKLDEEFKEAIRRMPEKEKDKLIFRLLKHDLILLNRLRFELLAEFTIEESRNFIKDEISQALKGLHDNSYYPLSDLYWYIRDFSGRISNHLSITRDKYGEVELLIFLVHEGLKTYHSLEVSNRKHPSNLDQYFINKLMKILLLIQKLNPDLKSDFKQDLFDIQEKLAVSELTMKLCIYNGFDINWLDLDKTPDNLQIIYKDARSQGYYATV
jgi:hypothetical protein